MEQNPELALAWQFIENTGTHLFLTGKAGTGKTTFHVLDNVLRAFRVHGLCDLQMESFWRDIVTLHQIQQGIHKIYIINVGPGNVDRDIDGLQALFVPLLHQLADLFPHILVQLGDEAVSLKKRDENRRGLHAPFRVGLFSVLLDHAGLDSSVL